MRLGALKQTNPFNFHTRINFPRKFIRASPIQCGWAGPSHGGRSPRWSTRALSLFSSLRSFALVGL